MAITPDPDGSEVTYPSNASVSVAATSVDPNDLPVAVTFAPSWQMDHVYVIGSEGINTPVAVESPAWS